MNLETLNPHIIRHDAVYPKYSASEYHVSYCTIDSSALYHNIKSFKSTLDTSTLLGIVLKSNAYGHGLVQIATLLQTNDVVDYMLVASTAEAVELRNSGITKPIIVLSILDQNLATAITLNCQLVVYDIHSLQKIIAHAGGALRINVHIKLDTGLSRLGIVPGELNSLLDYIDAHPSISVVGIFTHFAQAEHHNQSSTAYQQNLLQNAYEYCKQRYAKNIIMHSARSASLATTITKDTHLVRLGISAYGLWPSDNTRLNMQIQNPKFELKEVLAWYCKIYQLKYLPAQTSVGYDYTYTTKQASLIATLPIGYYDGLNRQLSNKGWVLINNQYAPIVGRISMNLTMVDVSLVTDVQHNSIVKLAGLHGLIAWDHQADLCNTISYELLTNIKPHIMRLVI